MMKSILIILISVLSVYSGQVEHPEVGAKVEKVLSKHFKLDAIRTVHIKELSTENDLFFKAYEGEKELGLVVLTSAKGRYEQFDFLMIYNQDLEIELIKILVYRSEYGSEITAKRWLRQFYLRQEENLKYGSDIQAISGATFSASSLTKNVNRINEKVKEYK